MEDNLKVILNRLTRLEKYSFKKGKRFPFFEMYSDLYERQPSLRDLIYNSNYVELMNKKRQYCLIEIVKQYKKFKYKLGDNKK